jgi:hypothetical protein
MLFAFPEDARWNAERQSVEIGEYRGVIRVPRRVFQRLLPGWPTPELCVEASYLQRTRGREHRLAEAARAPVDRGRDVEIGGRDLREGSASA